MYQERRQPRGDTESRYRQARPNDRSLLTSQKQGFEGNFPGQLGVEQPLSRHANQRGPPAASHPSDYCGGKRIVAPTVNQLEFSPLMLWP